MTISDPKNNVSSKQNLSPNFKLTPRQFLSSALISLGMVLVLGILTTAVLKVFDDFDSNADALFLPALYHDFVTGVPIYGWTIPAVAGFFPDMPLMFSILWITGQNISLSFAIYGAAVMFFLGAAIIYLIRGLIKLRWENMLLVYAMLLLWFLAILVSHDGSFLLLFMLMPNFHFGATLAGIIFLALTIRLFNRPLSKPIAILWVLIASISIASDSLFLIQFFVPVVICMYIFRRRSLFPDGLHLLETILFIILTSVLVLVFYEIARSIFILGSDGITDTTIQITNLLPLFLKYFGIFQPFFINNPIPSLIVLVGIVSSIVVLAFYLWSYYKAYSSKTSLSSPHNPYNISFCMLFFLISVVITITFPILASYTRYQLSLTGIRYFLPLYVYPVIIIPVFLLLLLYKQQYNTIRIAVIVTAILGSIGLASVMGGGILPKHPRAKPDLVKFFDHLHDSTGVSNGLGSFWVSKPTSLLSESEMHVDGIWFPWGIFPHTSNTWWYLDPNHKDGIKSRKYEFVVPYDKFPEVFIVAKFGLPAMVYKDPSINIEPCDGIFEGSEIHALIYNRKSDVAFRNYLYMPTIVHNNLKLPSYIFHPRNLQIFKSEGTPFNDKDCTILSPDQNVQITFSPPAEGDVIEICADFNDEYQADVYYSDGRIETLRVHVQPGNGLSRRILSLNNTKNTSIKGIIIRPIIGDGNFSVGHVFVFKDNW